MSCSWFVDANTNPIKPNMGKTVRERERGKEREKVKRDQNDPESTNHLPRPLPEVPSSLVGSLNFEGLSRARDGIY